MAHVHRAFTGSVAILVTLILAPTLAAEHEALVEPVAELLPVEPPVTPPGEEDLPVPVPDPVPGVGPAPDPGPLPDPDPVALVPGFVLESPATTTKQYCVETEDGDTCYRRDVTATSASAGGVSVEVRNIEEKSRGSHRLPEENHWWENASTYEATVNLDMAGVSAGATQSATIYRYHSEQPEQGAAIDALRIETSTVPLRNGQSAGDIDRYVTMTCTSRGDYSRCSIDNPVLNVERPIYCVNPLRTEAPVRDSVADCLIRNYGPVRLGSVPTPILP